MFSVMSVRHSVHRGRVYVTIIYDTLDLTLQLFLYRILPAASDILWPRLDICSNLFIKDLTVQGSSPRPVISGGWLHAVIEQAVGILLECFLVFKLFTHFIHCSFMYLKPFQLMLILSVAFEYCACGLISYLDSFSSLFLKRVFYVMNPILSDQTIFYRLEL